jgi:hypothetical protein
VLHKQRVTTPHGVVIVLQRIYTWLIALIVVHCDQFRDRLDSAKLKVPQRVYLLEHTADQQFLDACSQHTGNDKLTVSTKQYQP